MAVVSSQQHDAASYALTPWEEQTKIPEHYLHSTIRTPSRTKSRALTQAHSLLRGSRPKKTERQPLTFKSHPALRGNKNLGFLECIQYSWTDPSPTRGETKEQERKMIVGRRRTRKGLEIKSIKKRIVEPTATHISHFPFFADHRLVTESKLYSNGTPAATADGFFPRAKPKRSKDKTAPSLHPALSREFLGEISTIAALGEQRRRVEKCVTEEGKDWLVERSLFLQNNRKFKDWQRATSKTIASTITLPH